jgi:prolyl-tRNA synthetase
VRESLRDVARVFVDRRDDKTPGWKFNEWEMKGVPLRLEIGPRDVAGNQAMVVRRDTHEKQAIPLDELATRIPQLLEEIQDNMFETAKRMLDENTERVSTYERLKERVAANAGFSRVWWCGDETCEEKVKTETKATIRCIPFDQPGGAGDCIVCGKHSDTEVIMARAY